MHCGGFKKENGVRTSDVPEVNSRKLAHDFVQVRAIMDAVYEVN
ncbi:hypothetical protein [Aneurinibacillus tyrosinisolvens]|nr:hypothetical protein [Aneurinibacillus tyrosinisolvens]